MNPVTINSATVDEVMATGLIAQLDAELMARYPGEPVNGIDAAQFRAAGGYFVLARSEATAVGCGAFRPHDSTTVEVKRMFVRPEFRGRGIARRIIEAIEREAQRRGYTRSILETAVRQPEAIALYQSCGYSEIAKFGPYVESERSVCFGKAI